MHRGESFWVKKVYRSSHEYFELINKTKNNVIYDDTFLSRYIDKLKYFETICPHTNKWKKAMNNYDISDSNNLARFKLMNNFFK